MMNDFYKTCPIVLLLAFFLGCSERPQSSGQSQASGPSGLQGTWVLKRFCKSGIDIDLPNKDYLVLFDSKKVAWCPWTPGDLNATVGLKFTYELGINENIRYIKLTSEQLIGNNDKPDEVEYYFAYILNNDELIITQNSNKANVLPSKYITTAGDGFWTAYYARGP